MHDHPMHELFACGKGEIFLDLKNEKIKLSAGDAAIIPKGLSHNKSPDDLNAEYIALKFSCREISGNSSIDLYKDISPVSNSDEVIIFKRENGIYEGLMKIVENSESAHPVLPAIYMIELLIKCSGLNYTSLSHQSVENKGDTDTDINRISKLDQIIHNNYDEQLTSAEIADQLFISTRQLDRISKKRYGMPIHRAIMERRISTAEKILAESDAPIESIGSSLGFASRSSFYREFARKHGITPAEYRKKIRSRGNTNVGK